MIEDLSGKNLLEVPDKSRIISSPMDGFLLVGGFLLMVDSGVTVDQKKTPTSEKSYPWGLTFPGSQELMLREPHMTCTPLPALVSLSLWLAGKGVLHVMWVARGDGRGEENSLIVRVERIVALKADVNDSFVSDLKRVPLFFLSHSDYRHQISYHVAGYD